MRLKFLPELLLFPGHFPCAAVFCPRNAAQTRMFCCSGVFCPQIAAQTRMFCGARVFCPRKVAKTWMFCRAVQWSAVQWSGEQLTCRYKKRVSLIYRTATTAYPCCLPTLGEFCRSWSYMTYPGTKVKIFL